MGTLFTAEWLKYRRTFSWRLVLLAPLFFSLAVAGSLFLMAPEGRTGLVFAQMAGNWWVVTAVPLGAALLAALLQQHERRSGGERGLRVRPTPPAAHFLVKLLLLAVQTLFASLLYLGCLWLASRLALPSAGDGLGGAGSVSGGALAAVPWVRLAESLLLGWVAALPVLALQLWAAAAWGLAASLGLGFAGLVADAIAAPTRYWVWLPWSWPTRLMSPLLAVHPNGVPLVPGDPLLDRGVVGIALLLAVMGVAMFAVMAARWYAMREVR